MAAPRLESLEIDIDYKQYSYNLLDKYILKLDRLHQMYSKETLINAPENINWIQSNTVYRYQLSLLP
jgi:hypothetical protein